MNLIKNKFKNEPVKKALTLQKRYQELYKGRVIYQTLKMRKEVEMYEGN